MYLILSLRQITEMPMATPKSLDIEVGVNRQQSQVILVTYFVKF